MSNIDVLDQIYLSSHQLISDVYINNENVKKLQFVNTGEHNQLQIMEKGYTDRIRKFNEYVKWWMSEQGHCVLKDGKNQDNREKLILTSFYHVLSYHFFMSDGNGPAIGLPRCLSCNAMNHPNSKRNKLVYSWGNGDEVYSYCMDCKPSLPNFHRCNIRPCIGMSKCFYCLNGSTYFNICQECFSDTFRQVWHRPSSFDLV